MGAGREDHQAVLARQLGEAGAEPAQHRPRFPEIGGGRRRRLDLRPQQLPLRPGQARVGGGVEGFQHAPSRRAARRSVGQEVLLLDSETVGRVHGALLQGVGAWRR
jgi:hypothetical protein